MGAIAVEILIFLCYPHALKNGEKCRFFAAQEEILLLGFRRMLLKILAI